VSRQGRSARRTDTRGIVILAAFIGLVALFGGSSRQDAAQLLILRPVAALFLIPCAVVLTDISQARALRTLLAMLLLLAGWTAAQLVPLPPMLWQALPGREPIAALDGLLGTADTWRPLSLTPARGMGALASMVVPIVGLLLIMGYAKRRSHLVLALVALGLLNAGYGLVQVMTDALYPYQLSGRGSPVGFFANQNHSALLSAITLILLAYQLSEDRERRLGAGPRLAIGFAALVPLTSILLSGSRAGLMLGAVALVAGAAMQWLSRPRLAEAATRPGRFPIAGALAVAALVSLAGLAALIYWQAPNAVIAIGGGGDFEDLRWRIWPVLVEMARIYGLLGTGFGSFDRVFMIHEPDALLLPTYVNQAHNDFLQLVIEGGLPAAALAIWCLAWIARALLAVKRGAPDGSRVVAWAAIFGFILFASVFDYPLRTPLFQLVAIALLAVLAIERNRAGEPSRASTRASGRDTSRDSSRRSSARTQRRRER